MAPESGDGGAPAIGSGDSTVASIARTVVSTINDGIVNTVAHWKVLLFGQCVAFVLAVAGGTNEVLHFECKVNAPSTYNTFGYSLIAIWGCCMLRRDMKKDKAKNEPTTEEKERIVDEGEHEDHGEEDHNDDEDDELTLEDDSPRKRSIFSLRRNKQHRDRYWSSGKSHGSDSKLRPQYPFMCGLFTIHAKWYYYFAVAFIEAQAYYLVFLAFRYTSFTFVYVSDALAIPSAMIFTKLFMKRKYLWTHILGCTICIAGIVVNTADDIKLEDGMEHITSSEHIKGDICAIVGAILLGLDDVLSEIIVSDYGGVTEMLFMKGLFGAIISLVQMIILERDSLYALFSTEGSPCDLSWRMILFTVHIIARALDVAGEMQFLYISEA